MTLGPLPATGQWVRLELDAQSVGLAPDSWVTGVSFTQFDGKVNWDKSGIVTRILQWPLPSEDQSAWEEYELGSPQPPTGLSKAILDILQIAPAQRNESQRSEARNHFI
jgi:hypothetical protein